MSEQAIKESVATGWLTDSVTPTSGQYISRQEWGDQWKWAFLPSPYSLDANQNGNQTRERE